MNFKYYIIFNLLLSINFSCQSLPTNKNININIIAKVTKIDSTKSFYVINIKGYNKGIFSIPKECNKISTNKNRIKVGRKYKFILKSSSHTRPLGNIPTKSSFEELVDNKVIWSSSSNIIFYEDCLNMCGLYIYN